MAVMVAWSLTVRNGCTGGSSEEATYQSTAAVVTDSCTSDGTGSPADQCSLSRRAGCRDRRKWQESYDTESFE